MRKRGLMRHTVPAMREIELDLGRHELRRRGRRVKLEKKPMELLIFLVGRREQLVSREDPALLPIHKANPS
jgi:DNA-binding winged helix-turn-helix (wHTH) protein